MGARRRAVGERADVFSLDEGIDSGDIIWQKPFAITAEDGASSLYGKIKALATGAIGELVRIAFDASMAVRKSFHMGSLRVRRVLACEVPSETDAAAPIFTNAFIPIVYVDISGTLARKVDILGLYESEVQPEPFPRAPSTVRALARHRGATVGVTYAEAFMLVREIA